MSVVHASALRALSRASRGVEIAGLDPGPSSLQVRGFSDALDNEGEDNSVVQGLKVKVQRDRKAEQRLAVLKHEWVSLFADADHLCEMSELLIIPMLPFQHADTS